MLSLMHKLKYETGWCHYVIVRIILHERRSILRNPDDEFMPGQYVRVLFLAEELPILVTVLVLYAVTVHVELAVTHVSPLVQDLADHTPLRTEPARAWSTAVCHQVQVRVGRER